MTIKTEAALLAYADTNLADNTNGDVLPVHERTMAKDTVELAFDRIDDNTADIATNVTDIMANTDSQAATLTPAGTTQTIDFDNGKGQVLDLGSATGDVTLTLSNPVEGNSYIIKIIQGATARDVVLPSTVLLPEGTAPTTLDIPATDNAIDALTLYYDGTNYLAQFAQAFG